MRGLALLLLLVPAALPAQSILEVSPQQCVWHAGDNPAWAEPTLDDAAWQPYTQFHGDIARMWVRCHANLDSLRGISDPAVQIRVDSAYELFINGRKLGGSGNLASGFDNLNTIRLYPLADSPGASPATIAMRLSSRPVANSDFSASLWPNVSIGSAGVLQAMRDQVLVAQVRAVLPFVVLYSIIGIAGVLTFALYYYDRARRELFWLALLCVVVACLRLNRLCSAALVDYSSQIFGGIYLLGNFGFIFQMLFFFALAGRRVPKTFWLLYAASQAADLLLFIQWLGSAGLDLRINRIFMPVQVFSLSAWALLSFAPAVAFWPWTRIPPRLRPLVAFCFLWGTADAVWFSVQALNIFMAYSNLFYELRAVLTTASILILLGLLFRDQRRVTQDRALLAGEMASAREIQQYLIPETLPPTPGINIRSVYQPSREVGGDFFQILPDPRDGSTLIVVGDVAGKGLKAGMLAALIVGAIRTAFKFTSDPGRILALLNERLQGRGLVTCLAIRIDRDGSAELANAGHLPPYVDGQELALDGALPLGALPDVGFPTLRLRLIEGQSMLLVSDGVVEAQNQHGELFGFERTRAISTQSAEAIAAAAQAHGQEDDITVLSVTRTANIEVAIA
ncbi:MAG TPA: PP2C family protein-serine/threonine phosphatase [Terracidiphilus sp.]|jgi:hypothetical protein|nr:PP2C family protein-serine/threonine phosphatase [Terracidiphilus sp.]